MGRTSKILTILISPNGSLRGKSKKEHPELDKEDIFYMKMVAKGRIKHAELDKKQITSDEFFISAPQIYWTNLAKVKNLIKTVESEYKLKNRNSIWNSKKTITVESFAAIKERSIQQIVESIPVVERYPEHKPMLQLVPTYKKFTDEDLVNNF